MNEHIKERRENCYPLYKLTSFSPPNAGCRRQQGHSLGRDSVPNHVFQTSSVSIISSKRIPRDYQLVICMVLIIIIPQSYQMLFLFVEYIIVLRICLERYFMMMLSGSRVSVDGPHQNRFCELNLKSFRAHSTPHDEK